MIRFLLSILFVLFYIFSYSQVTWNQLGQTIDGVQSGGYTGCSVALNGDGTRVAIGSHSNSNGGHETGRLQIYDFINGSWNQIFDVSGSGSNNALGTSVSMSDNGSTVVVGAPYHVSYCIGIIITSESIPSLSSVKQ